MQESITLQQQGGTSGRLEATTKSSVPEAVLFGIGRAEETGMIGVGEAAGGTRGTSDVLSPEPNAGSKKGPAAYICSTYT